MRKILTLVLIIIVAVVVGGCINPPPPTTDVIYIQPKYSYAYLDDSFTVTINCDTLRFIKAWDSEIKFDTDALYAIDVTFGDIFEGREVFNSPSIIIDNVNGTIKNLYAVLLQEGEIRNSGSLYSIEFITDTTGTANIELVDTHLYNSTDKILVSTENGTVTIR